MLFDRLPEKFPPSLYFRVIFHWVRYYRGLSVCNCEPRPSLATRTLYFHSPILYSGNNYTKLVVTAATIHALFRERFSHRAAHFQQQAQYTTNTCQPSVVG